MRFLPDLSGEMVEIDTTEISPGRRQPCTHRGGDVVRNTYKGGGFIDVAEDFGILSPNGHPRRGEKWEVDKAPDANSRSVKCIATPRPSNSPRPVSSLRFNMEKRRWDLLLLAIFAIPLVTTET